MADCPHIGSAVRIASVNIQQLKELAPGSRDRGKQPPYLGRENSRTRFGSGGRRFSKFVIASRSLPNACFSAQDNWNCVTCGTTESPWLCLSCGLIHCGRYIKEDGLRHFNKYKDHCVCMECYNYGIFWYVFQVS